MEEWNLTDPSRAHDVNEGRRRDHTHGLDAVSCSALTVARGGPTEKILASDQPRHAIQQDEDAVGKPLD